MRLRDLDPEFLRIIRDDQGQVSSYRIVATLGEADGIQFQCPACFAKNGGGVGTHYVCCWFKHVSPDVDPRPGRWAPQGTGVDDLTFVPWEGRSQSVQLGSGCRWHGLIVNGEARTV